MERFILPSIHLGAIAGVIFGILLLIPFVSPFVFFLMFILSGAGVIVVLKRYNSVGILSIYDGCSIGAIAGFISLIAASIVYIPVASLLGGFFSFKGLGFSILAVMLLVFSTAILSALFNAFSGLVTAYVYEKIETRHLSFKDHFEIEEGEQGELEEQEV
ncbi:MAG: hypothetical protein A2Y25_05910 [Candidatus Melainabacteria bacterium GWF2_37_15]|nr:MAG: hypothetical protein A2Y25_05910 [Candidatus Melainabacteria bacterium GWF2_37_15]